MILWLFAFGLMAALGVIGYYQGALRVAFSLVGLILAAFVCIPLGHLVQPVFPVFGLTHPVLIAFVGPAVVYLLILIIFKSVAFGVHRKLTTLYKYNNSDTKRLLWERLNERLGICLGLANAVVYLFLVATVAYVLGYFTIQVATSDEDSAAVKFANKVAQQIHDTGMDRAVAPFVPVSELYYDASDVLGLIYHNPLLQSRLASYPVFLNLTENTRFQNIANDQKFQEFWAKGPTVSELVNHEKMQPLIEDVSMYTNVMSLLNWNLKDLKGYLETGTSAKYDDEKILGRWDYAYQESFIRAKRSKPNMGSVELRLAKRVLGALVNANFTAFIDKQAVLRLPTTNNVILTLKGNWRREGDGKYVLSLKEGGKSLEPQATVEGNKLIFSKDGYALIFEK